MGCWRFACHFSTLVFAFSLGVYSFIFIFIFYFLFPSFPSASSSSLLLVVHIIAFIPAVAALSKLTWIWGKFDGLFSPQLELDPWSYLFILDLSLLVLSSSPSLVISDSVLFQITVHYVCFIYYGGKVPFRIFTPTVSCYLCV